jgi:hypothetical protein
MSWRARPSCATARRSAKISAPFPDGLYPGDYLVPVGAALAKEHGDKLKAMPENQWLPLVRAKAIAMMMAMIRDDLAALNVKHDVFFSERSLVEGSDQVGATIEELRQKGHVYEGRLPPPKGAPVEDYEDREQTLFRATASATTSTGPLKKSDGSYTYFASDIAYHKSKFDRGFRDMIDVWGADHGGYIKRMKAAVKAVSDESAELDVKIVQLVKLMRAGVEVKMSKRLGRIRHAPRGRRRGRPRRRALHDAVSQERCAARFRPRQGDRAVEGQSGFLRPVRPRARPFGVPQCRRGAAGSAGGGRRPHGLFVAGGTRAARRPGELSLMRKLALYPGSSKPRRWPMSRTGWPSISMNWQANFTGNGRAGPARLIYASLSNMIHN